MIPSMTSQYAIEVLLDRILHTGKVTAADQRNLWWAAKSMERPLSTVEQAKVRQMFERVQLGLLHVED